MAKRISATTATRQFSDILDRVERGGTEFIVERHGRAVATIGPAYGRVRGISGRELRELLESLPKPDAAFERDIAWIRRQQGRFPNNPWPSSSTRRS